MNSPSLKSNEAHGKLLDEGTIAHALFGLYEVKDTCEWLGTTYDENFNLLSCGAKTVGAGLFCDPTHSHCFICSVCERHKQPICQDVTYEC